MGWKGRVPRKYSGPHIKVMLILQKHHVIFVSEQGFPLSPKRGDGVWADIYLPGPRVRIECDDPYFKPDMNGYLEKDARLEKQYGIQTVRLENRRIMLVSGEAYVKEQLGKWLQWG
jgi:hypothetical protein